MVSDVEAFWGCIGGNEGEDGTEEDGMKEDRMKEERRLNRDGEGEGNERGDTVIDGAIASDDVVLYGTIYTTNCIY